MIEKRINSLFIYLFYVGGQEILIYSSFDTIEIKKSYIYFGILDITPIFFLLFFFSYLWIAHAQVVGRVYTSKEYFETYSLVDCVKFYFAFDIRFLSFQYLRPKFYLWWHGLLFVRYIQLTLVWYHEKIEYNLFDIRFIYIIIYEFNH